MQTGHMVTLLKTSGHGSYGNTITAANIIDGVIKLADDNNATSIFSKLNTAVNHNKLQVALQAWWQHTDLHEKIAYGVYEFGHNLTKHSVRCEHFFTSHCRHRDQLQHHDILAFRGTLQRMEDSSS
jgi:hypothetical protein